MTAISLTRGYEVIDGELLCECCGEEFQRTFAYLNNGPEFVARELKILLAEDEPSMGNTSK